MKFSKVGRGQLIFDMVSELRERYLNIASIMEEGGENPVRSDAVFNVLNLGDIVRGSNLLRHIQRSAQAIGTVAGE